MTEEQRPIFDMTGTAERPLQWATSRRVGDISELAVLAPIKRGSPLGERRTFEERLRGLIANLAKRHEQGIPTELDRVTSIHFGRMLIIRPEQYLWYSKVEGVSYDQTQPQTASRGDMVAVPLPLDPYLDPDLTLKPGEKDPELRSWLLVLVEFDGDLKSYMRDIAQFTGKEFDNIFANCEHYPTTESFDVFWSWIRTFQVRTDLFYSTYPNLSVARLKHLETFKRRFDAFVASVRSPTGPRVGSMDEMFDEFLRENQQYATGFPAPGGTYSPDRDRHDR